MFNKWILNFVNFESLEGVVIRTLTFRGCETFSRSVYFRI